MKKGSGHAFILLGGILELCIFIFTILIIYLYVTSSDADLLKSVNLTETEGIKALFILYGCAVLHLVAAVIALMCKSKSSRYFPVVIIGLALIIISNMTTVWPNASIMNVIINTLPGGLLIIGAMMNKVSRNK